MLPTWVRIENRAGCPAAEWRQLRQIGHWISGPGWFRKNCRRFGIMFRHKCGCYWFHCRRFFKKRYRRHWFLFHNRYIDDFLTGLHHRYRHFNDRSKGGFKISLGFMLGGSLRFQLHRVLDLWLGHNRLGLDRLSQNRLGDRLGDHLQNAGSNSHVGSKFAGQIGCAIQHV